MRKMLVLCLLVPFIGFSQAKLVLNGTRIFPRQDKIAEFEKALASHAQKYHTGDWKWRVWEIQSGPDAGGYLVTEGPTSWEQVDGRNDLGAEHTEDYTKNVAPLTIDRGGSEYLEFQTDLSTVALTDYADKIVINHSNIKPGKIANAPDLLKKWKAAWQAGNESVAVYMKVASGNPGFVTVTRLKAGLKELATGYRKPMKDRFPTTGDGTYEAFSKEYIEVVESRWSELLIYKPELSSKQ